MRLIENELSHSNRLQRIRTSGQRFLGINVPQKATLLVATEA